MRKIEKEFGFCPEPLEIKVGSIKVSPFPELRSIVDTVLSCEEIENDWIYAPPQQVRDFMSGKIRERPYSSRVFGLPKTHVIEHARATSDEHLDFLIWALSFFVGMRLTATEAGFLDATPVKPRKLFDFVLLGQGLERAVELADSFWVMNQSEPRSAQRFEAAIHALFLGQYPQALLFESFIHLYTAIDACYALTKELWPPKQYITHSERIEWMCGKLGRVHTTGARCGRLAEWKSPKPNTSVSPTVYRSSGATCASPIGRC